MNRKKIVLSLVFALMCLFMLSLCVFADGECQHEYTDDNDCSTAVFCDICGDEVVPAKVHRLRSARIEYPDNNFLAEGTRYIVCITNGCDYTDERVAEPFMSALGYSFSGGNICASYSVNSLAMEEYRSVYGILFEYGLLTTSKANLDSLEGGEALDEEGEPANSKIIKADFTDSRFSVCDLILSGLSEALWDAEIVISAYFKFSDETYYVQGAELVNTSADFDTVTYNEVKNLHDSLYNQEENVGDQQATSGFFTCALAPSTKKYLF